MLTLTQMQAMKVINMHNWKTKVCTGLMTQQDPKKDVQHENARHCACVCGGVLAPGSMCVWWCHSTRQHVCVVVSWHHTMLLQFYTTGHCPLTLPPARP